MLVLTRKAGEALRFDGPATVTIGRIRGGKVQVCIEAPDSTKVLRDELPESPTEPQHDEPTL